MELRKERDKFRNGMLNVVAAATDTRNQGHLLCVEIGDSDPEIIVALPLSQAETAFGER